MFVGTWKWKEHKLTIFSCTCKDQAHNQAKEFWRESVSSSHKFSIYSKHWVKPLEQTQAIKVISTPLHNLSLNTSHESCIDSWCTKLQKSHVYVFDINQQIWHNIEIQYSCTNAYRIQDTYLAISTLAWILQVLDYIDFAIL